MAASDARLLTGTASWTDKPLIESGTFYPPGAKDAEARLRYYASQFPLVEADTTYYGLPTEQTVRAWVDRTPDGFTFDVKAYSLFTDHPTPVARLPKAIQAQLPSALTQKRQFYRKDAPQEIVDLCWSTFIDALRPLHESGRLGAIVFQFPKWVFPGDATLAYFEEIRDRIGPFRGGWSRRAADEKGGRDPAPRCGRNEEPGDRRSSVHQSLHRQASHRECLRQAGRQSPHRSRRPRERAGPALRVRRRPYRLPRAGRPTSTSPGPTPLVDPRLPHLQLHPLITPPAAPFG